MKQRKQFPLEPRPRLLKDFLIDDSNSCSSSGFKSFPRGQPEDVSVRNMINNDFGASNPSKLNTAQERRQLTRSRSKAASMTISALQAVINAVRNIPFAAVKSPSILPRSLSRRLSKKSDKKEYFDQNPIKITVRVKDIIRWRSSRDLIEEKIETLDTNSPPHDYTTTNTTTTTTSTTGCTSTPRSSNGSSWSETDFASEYLPSWCCNSEDYGGNDVEMSKKYSPCVGRDCLEATTEIASYTSEEVGPKGELQCEEKEQHSPISVLDFPFEEDEESLSSFDQNLVNVERAKQKLMQKIRRFESIANLDPVNLEKWMSMEETTSHEGSDDDDNADGEEEKDEEKETNEVEKRAMHMLNHVKLTSKGRCVEIVELLLLDLFRDELTKRRSRLYTRRNDELDSETEIVGLAKGWLSGEHKATVELGVEHDKEAYVREMNRKGKWSNFEEEQEELVLGIESWVFSDLVDELLQDLTLA